MPTISEHQQVVSLIRALSEALDRQSRWLSAQFLKAAKPNELAGDSPLLHTWSNLGVAFKLLAAHYQSLETACRRSAPDQ